MANPINDKYQELRRTEQEIFQAYPLLKVAKPAIQTLAMPALVAGAATHLPLAGPAVAGAIGHGTDFVQNNLHGLREAQLTKHFAEMRQNIQPGFAYWARQRAFDDWATLRSADLLGKSDMLTRPLAGYLAPTAVGKAMMDAGPMVAKYVTQLPISTAIGRTIDQTQAIFSNVQDWIHSSYQNVREYGIHAEKFVQKELNKLSNNQDPKQANQQKVSQELQSQNGHKVDAPATVLGTSETQIEPETPQVKQEKKPEQTLRDEPQKQAPDTDLQETPEYLDDGIPEFLTKSKQEPDKIAQDYFQALASEIAGKGMNADGMRFFFNNEEVFRLSDGQPDLKHTTVSNEQMAAFKAALEDPANFKGTLEIRQGNKLLLSIIDGQVFDPMQKVQDLLQVKMTAPAETIPETTTQGFYQKASEGVQSTGIDEVVDIAKNAINNGHSQAEITSMLLENNPHIKAIESKHGPDMARDTAHDLIQSASDELLMARPDIQQDQAQQQEHSQQQDQTVSQSF